MHYRLAMVAASAALVSAACGSPAVPFDTLEASNAVVYRLQNYEPPPPPAAAPAAAPQGMIPGIPPEIQAWAQQAVPALQQMIPPGVLPPGLIPGLPAAAVPAPTPDAPRFHGFRILEQQPLMDSELKEDLAELFGDPDSFQPQHANCLYAEMGLSFSATPGAPPNDVLVSFSCNQVQGHNFIWPHPTTGLKSSTVEKLAEMVAKMFPPQAMPAPMPPAAENSALPVVRL